MSYDTNPRRSVRAWSAPDSSRSQLYVPQCRLFSWKNTKPTPGELDLDLKRRLNSRTKGGLNSVRKAQPRSETPTKLDIVPTRLPFRNNDLVGRNTASMLLPRRRVLANSWSLSSENTSEAGHDDLEDTTTGHVTDIETRDPDKLNVQSIVEDILGSVDTDYADDVMFIKLVGDRSSLTIDCRCPSALLKTKSSDSMRLNSFEMRDVGKRMLVNCGATHKPTNFTISSCTNISKPTSKSLQLYNLSIWPVTDRGIQRPAQKSRSCWLSDHRDNRWKVEVTDKEWIDMLHASPNDPILRRLGLCSSAAASPSSKRGTPMYNLERSRTGYTNSDYLEPHLSSSISASTRRSKTRVSASASCASPQSSKEDNSPNTHSTDTSWKIMLDTRHTPMKQPLNLITETSVNQSTIPSFIPNTKTPCNSPTLSSDEDDGNLQWNTAKPSYHVRSDFKPTDLHTVSDVLVAHKLVGVERKAASTKTGFHNPLTTGLCMCSEPIDSNVTTLQTIVVPY